MFQDTKKKAISRQPICLTDADYDYIFQEIGGRYKIEFEREVGFYSVDMEDYYDHLNEFICTYYILCFNYHKFLLLFQHKLVSFEYEILSKSI